MTDPRAVAGHLVLRTLGEGGMGVVYLARDERLGREVALKVLRADQLPFEGARARFASEVRSAALLSHPGIAAVYEVGEQDGRPWFTQEHVEGAPLSALLARVASRDPRTLDGADFRAALAGAMEGADVPAWDAEFFEHSWSSVCARVVRQVADALQHAHERGVIHGDVKPSNVLLTPGGRAVLVDFGVAHRPDGVTHGEGQAPAGSLAYLPPEIVDGRQEHVDARGDVYSLGVLLHELIALRNPFASGSLERTRGRVLAGVAPRLATLNPAVPADLATVCACARAHSPQARYADAAAFSGDLGNVLAHRPIRARRPGPLRRLARWSQRRPGRAAVVAAAFLALVVAPGVLGIQRGLAAAELRAVGADLDAMLAERRQHLASVLEGIGFLGERLSAPDLVEIPEAARLRADVAERALQVLERVDLTAPGDVGVQREIERFEAMRAQASESD